MTDEITIAPLVAGLFTLLAVILGAGLTGFGQLVRWYFRRRGVAALLYVEMQEILTYINAVVSLPRNQASEMYERIPTPAFNAHSATAANTSSGSYRTA
jgi:hypothetical protein